MRTPRIEIYRSARRQWKFNRNEIETVPEYRWRMRASNGRIVSESGEGYIEPRSLVRGLEIAHPGYFLEPDPWTGWDLAHYLVSDSIPVTVPEGTESLWAARRNR